MNNAYSLALGLFEYHWPRSSRSNWVVTRVHSGTASVSTPALFRNARRSVAKNSREELAVN